MVIPLLLALFLSLTSFAHNAIASVKPISFDFDHFPKNVNLDSAIALYGDAVVEDFAVRMTGAGKILYRKPFKFLWGSGNSGFSTYFCFSISSFGANNLAFFLDSADSRLLRLSKNVFLVEFTRNESVGRIGIRVGRELNAKSCIFSSSDDMVSIGGKLHSWVEYDGVSKRIDVRLSKFRARRPASPFISCPVDMSSVLQMEALIVGISSSSDYSTLTERDLNHSSFIYSWSFVIKHGAPYRMHSEPLDPRSYAVVSEDGSRVHRRNSYSRVNVMAWLFGLVCGALMAFMLVFARNLISCWSPVANVECPVHPVDTGYDEEAVIVGEKVMKGCFKGKSISVRSSSKRDNNGDDVISPHGDEPVTPRVSKWQEHHNNIFGEILLEQFLQGNITNGLVRRQSISTLMWEEYELMRGRRN